MKRRGIAAVEFALVLPLFVFLMLGMVELGRFIQVNQVIVNAAREGARDYASTPGTPDSAIKTTKNCLHVAGFDTSLSTITPSQEITDRGVKVKVDISLPFPSVAIFPPFIAHGNVHSMEVFRKEMTND